MIRGEYVRTKEIYGRFADEYNLAEKLSYEELEEEMEERARQEEADSVVLAEEKQFE